MAADRIDRRKFLFNSGTSLGGLLKSPALGLFGAVVDMVTTASAEVPDDRKRAACPARRLLRAGEPINARGQPFGHDVSGMVAVAAGEHRLFLVVGHANARPGCEDKIARRTTGISVLDLVMRDGRWQHDVASPCNRRWDLDSSMPLDGARLGPDGKLFHVQRPEGGIGSVSCAIATPWRTVLCAERDGWIIEINPFAGHAVRRLSMGKVGAVSLRIEAEGGKPVAVYLQSNTNLFKFVSHQFYDARELQRNYAILVIGDLYVTDSQSKLVSFSQGCQGEEWVEKMHRIPGDSDVIQPAVNAKVDFRAHDFYIQHDETGARIMVIEGR